MCLMLLMLVVVFAYLVHYFFRLSCFCKSFLPSISLVVLDGLASISKNITTVCINVTGILWLFSQLNNILTVHQLIFRI